MRVVITGATGLIGRGVIDALSRRGDTIVALSRDRASASQRLGPGVEIHEWAAPTETPAPAEALSGADAVIHLLGEPVAQRWTAQTQSAIRDSRILGTRNLIAGLRAVPSAERPSVLVSQSATGYYGPRDATPLDETAAPGHDFLADVVVGWESEAEEAEDLGRVVLTRTGVVLAPEGGALDKMLPFFRLGIGGPVAGGHQYIPWIHVDDVIGGLLRALDDSALSGAVNLTAPTPATNAELSQALGRALHRPAVLPIPGAAVKLLYGGMATIVVTGQRAVPRQLERVGYQFRYPRLDGALKAVVSSA
jgi:uncharacterized protein (TIGR01777 family)